MENKLRKGGTIDNDLQKAVNAEREKWRHIRKIVVETILFCAKNNLAKHHQCHWRPKNWSFFECP